MINLFISRMGLKTVAVISSFTPCGEVFLSVSILVMKFFVHEWRVEVCFRCLLSSSISYSATTMLRLTEHFLFVLESFAGLINSSGGHQLITDF